MEVSVRNDPDLATEVITLLGKELKSARERIKELEAQHENRENPIVIDDWQERAEASETSVGHLKAEVEKLSVENTALKLLIEEYKDVRVKEEVTEEKYSILPPEERHDAVPDMDLENKVKELEEALEVYYKKYKAQKEAKQTLQKSLAKLKSQVKDPTPENEQLQQVAELTGPKRSQASQTKRPVLTGLHEIWDFILQFPQCHSRPHYSRLHPICDRGVNITAYLHSEANLAKFTSSFLYLPGRLLWCSLVDSQHGMALGPQHIFDTNKGYWEMKSMFEGLYGKSFELFYLAKNHIFYGGTYTCHNLRSWSPEGSPMPTKRVNPDALVKATLKNSDTVTDSERKSLETSIERLYIDHVLKVEVMGLQCTGFNDELYEALDRRFRASLPVLGKREGSKLEGRKSVKKSRDMS